MWIWLAAHQNIKSLEAISTEKTANNEVLKNKISEKDVMVSTLNLEIHQLNQENDGFRTTVENLTQEIKGLKRKAGRLQTD